MELCEDKSDAGTSWKPLLLIIPLRLGLSEINPIYVAGLKKCFELAGNCGMIGGRPNQALYFIGYVGDEALFLDPHTVQRSGSIGDKTGLDEREMDESFHQRYARRINFKAMDPSLALCFLCATRTEFDDLLARFAEDLNGGSCQGLFEVTKTRQAPWTPTTASSTSSRKNSEPNETFNEISATEIVNEGNFRLFPKFGTKNSTKDFLFPTEFEEVESRPLDESDEEFEIIA